MTVLTRQRRGPGGMRGHSSPKHRDSLPSILLALKISSFDEIKFWRAAMPRREMRSHGVQLEEPRMINFRYFPWGDEPPLQGDGGRKLPSLSRIDTAKANGIECIKPIIIPPTVKKLTSCRQRLP